MKNNNKFGNYSNMVSVVKDYVRRKWLPVLSAGETVGVDEIFYDLEVNMIPFSELNIKKFLRRMCEHEGFIYDDINQRVVGNKQEGEQI